MLDIYGPIRHMSTQ